MRKPPWVMAFSLAVAVGLSCYPAVSDDAIDFDGFDRSTRAQDDFFQFVNGKWFADTEIPPDKGRYGSFLLLRDRASEHVREIVEQISQNEGLEFGSDSQKIRDLFNSYMNEERINELGISPIEGQLKRVQGISTKRELMKYFGAGSKLGIQRPIAIGINQDSKKPDQYITYINQSGLGMPDRDYYLDEGPRAEMLRKAYVRYLTRLFELAGDENPQAKADLVMAMETSLAKHHWTRVENRDRYKTYNKRTLDQLTKLTPAFAWTDMFEQAGLGAETSFVVRQPSYIDGFGEIFASTSLEDWKTYLRLKVISSFASSLSDPFFQASFEFYSKTLRGLQQPEPRWKRAVSTLNGSVGQLVGKEYVKKHFPAEAKQRMQELVANLLSAMEDSIKTLPWMEKQTKKEALAKLAKFNTKIGYPDKWKDYSKLEIRPNDLVGNLIRLSIFEHERAIGKLGGPIDRTEWFMNPQTVNAYYNPLMNEIVFPAAILQPPFFNLDADDAVNYGAIGAVIGHEIGHGFDDQGRKSDGNGLLRDWWTQNDADEYVKRTDKLVVQYNLFAPVKDATVNGRLTLGENIGDLGGITLAYRAYQKSLEGKEPPKVGSYTGEQRFFLAFAQIWRVKARESFLRQQLKTDPHSPPRYRVMGVLQNFDPFYKAFGLSETDRMYLSPEERVQIW